MSHNPGRMALLRRCAFGPDVTPVKRDRILRLIFPTLPYEATLRVLHEASDLHHSGHPVDASRVLESLLDDQETPSAG